MRTSIGLFGILGLVIATAGCNSSDDDNASPSSGGGGGGGNSGLTINSTEGIQLTIDGSSASYSVGNPVFGGYGGHDNGNLYAYSYGLSNYTTIQQIYTVMLGVVQSPGTVSDTAFFSLGAPGTRVYSDPDALQQGVYFSWYDASGAEWSTKCGSGAQSGSTFTITDRQEHPNAVPMTWMKLRATFNCKLYKCSDPAQFKTVTNGVAVFSLQKL